MKAAKYHLMGSAALIAAVLTVYAPKVVSTDEPGNPEGETPVSGGGTNCLEIQVAVQGGITPVWQKCSAPGLLGTVWTWKCLESELREPTLHRCVPGHSFRQCDPKTVHATGVSGGRCRSLAIPFIEECQDPDPVNPPGVPRTTSTGSESCRPGA